MNGFFQPLPAGGLHTLLGLHSLLVSSLLGLLHLLELPQTHLILMTLHIRLRLCLLGAGIRLFSRSPMALFLFGLLLVLRRFPGRNGPGDISAYVQC
ncbi:MAG: hypothetical protein A2X83_02565 [Desulfuromonadales bacterium GWD2_54_10]|nr:MAG: hypothetical protein A2X83_02565 [Desulfuromonadales bacterium GWD2_54_10]